METLGDWILQQLEERGWTQAELARRSGIREATISRIISGSRGPGPDSCLAIAKALNRPVDEVYRRAGLLPPMLPIAEGEEELLLHYRNMNEAGRREAVAILKALRESKEQYRS